MNTCNIRRTFAQKKERGWDTIYVLLDVHGTILHSTYAEGNKLEFISPACVPVLQWFTKRKDIKIILWTSSYPDEIAKVIDWLKTYDIEIDFVNRNPECKNTKYADFATKPYFNIIIDDKAGMTPDVDWLFIARELEIVTGESIITWTPEKKRELSEKLSNMFYSLAALTVFP